MTTGEGLPNCSGRKIVSLFDFSGNWPRPYAEAGANVILIDLKHGIDIMDIDATWIMDNILNKYGTVDAVLAAPPCTDFSLSGAQYWPAKDADGRTAKSVALVRQALKVIERLKPSVWCIENPRGRIRKLIPELGRPRHFDPADYGDPYTKRTALFGKFRMPMGLAGELFGQPVVKIRSSSQGSWIQRLGGKSERTKTLRSVTPLGFAYAFMKANSWGSSCSDS